MGGECGTIAAAAAAGPVNERVKVEPLTL